MKHFVACVTGAATLSFAAGAPALAQTTPLLPNPQIEIQYVPPQNPVFFQIYERLRRRQVLETLQLFLAPVKLPVDHKLLVKFDQCKGETSLPYEHGGPVTICYDYVAQIEQGAPREPVILVQGNVTPEAALMGPVVQAALHQVALALFDTFELPVWGRRDDAADRLTAFVMVQFGPAVAWNTIMGTAWFLANNAELTPSDYADVRGLVAQRFYTTVCIAYGAQRSKEPVADPKSGIDFSNWVGNRAAGTLPVSRAQSCAYEYQLIKQAFATLFVKAQPQLVDQALLEQLQKELVCSKGQAGDKLFKFACTTNR